MSVAGEAGASNGYSYAPLDVSTARYTTLRVKLSGSENARYYIDAMGEGGDIVLASKWQDTPLEPKEATYKLPPNRGIRWLVLYTWTEDGKGAENRFTDVAFVGEKGVVRHRRGTLDASVRLDTVFVAPGRRDPHARAAGADVSGTRVVGVEAPLATRG